MGLTMTSQSSILPTDSAEDPKKEKHWSMVRGLRKTGDLLARSDLCHLHEGRAEAESCALDEKLHGQDRDVVLVARSGSNQHVWVVLRSLSEIINGYVDARRAGKVQFGGGDEQVAALCSACLCRSRTCWPRWNQPIRASFRLRA